MDSLRIPLFLVGAIALLSGGLKARERARAYYGGVGLGIVEVLVGGACMTVALIGIPSYTAMAGLMSLAGGVFFVSTVSRPFKASELRKGREESESRRLYAQIKYAEALAGPTHATGVPPSLENTTADESPAEGGTSADPVPYGDAPEGSPGNAPPSTIDGKDSWTV